MRGAYSPVVDAPGLVHCEQHVNDRFGTDPAPALPPAMLPEAGAWQPLSWVVGEPDQLEVLSDSGQEESLWKALFRRSDGASLFPVHPLTAARFNASELVQSGSFTVGASYRTVFFEPPAAHPAAALIPAGHMLMIKLHLDDPLPGNAGDRRLTPVKVRKCIGLSRQLPRDLELLQDRHTLQIVRERAGVLLGDRGAIIRIVPHSRMLPLFSVYSRDSTRPGERPVLLKVLDHLGLSADEVAERFGELLCEPLLRGLMAGFALGYSFEMHAQNTLVSFGDRTVIGNVHFRDLESVYFFPEIRARHGFPRADLDLENRELFPSIKPASRWFNRNVDHDIGRIFRALLHAMQKEDYFTDSRVKIAIQSCRLRYRALVDEFDLHDLNGLGRWLPVSRTPYGTGWRRGDYYRSTFR